MGKQHCINLSKLQGHQLHTDIWSTVNQHTRATRFNHRSCTIAKIARAIAGTNLTFTTNDRHAIGGACT